MLWEFGFKNYYGFREGGSISFALDANCPVTISKGRSFTPILCVKGANASGKTSVLRAITFLAQFGRWSFNSDPEAPIPIAEHFDNDSPTELYADFEVRGVRYLYEISLTDQKVVREAIYRKKKKLTPIVERVGLEFALLTKEFEGLRKMTLRKNASLVSTAYQYQLPQLLDLYSFFASVVSNVSYSGHLYDGNELDVIAERLYKDPALNGFIVGFLRGIDIGLTGISVMEREEPDPSNPDRKKKSYFVWFEHGSSRRRISYFTESNGTRVLVSRLAKILTVLENGGLLVADEFDLHLHPFILPKLLELFVQESTNPKGGQLIFSTHDGEVLDFMGKYRTYLVNKDDNESFAYRLDEIGGDILRNDRSMLPLYREGRLGGTPRL